MWKSHIVQTVGVWTPVHSDEKLLDTNNKISSCDRVLILITKFKSSSSMITFPSAFYIQRFQISFEDLQITQLHLPPCCLDSESKDEVKTPMRAGPGPGGKNLGLVVEPGPDGET